MAMYPFWDDWQLYHKVTFDGTNKQILIPASVSAVSVKVDIYSDWKEWMLIRDNAKFLPAIRSIGGDPVGGGLYAGDMYFLMNGWQIVVDHSVAINGILYHDDGISPYVVMQEGAVTSTVSNLAYAYNTTGSAAAPTVQQIRNEMDTNSLQLALIKAATDVLAANEAILIATTNTLLGASSASAPTVQEIRTELDTNSAQLAAIKAKADAIGADTSTLLDTTNNILAVVV